MRCIFSFILQFVKARRQSETSIDKICLRISALASAGAPGGAPQSDVSLQRPLCLEDASLNPAGDSICSQGGPSVGTQGGGPLGQGSCSSPEALGACLSVYLEALSAIVLSCANTTKAFERLNGCWQLLRTAVGVSDAAAAHLRELCRRGALRVAGKTRNNKGRGPLCDRTQQGDLNSNRNNNDVSRTPSPLRGPQYPHGGPHKPAPKFIRSATVAVLFVWWLGFRV